MLQGIIQRPARGRCIGRFRIAAGALFQGLDDLVAVAGGVGEEGEDDQAKVALIEEPAAAAPSSVALMTAETAAPKAAAHSAFTGQMVRVTSKVSMHY